MNLQQLLQSEGAQNFEFTTKNPLDDLAEEFTKSPEAVGEKNIWKLEWLRHVNRMLSSTFLYGSGLKVRSETYLLLHKTKPIVLLGSANHTHNIDTPVIVVMNFETLELAFVKADALHETAAYFAPLNGVYEFTDPYIIHNRNIFMRNLYSVAEGDFEHGSTYYRATQAGVKTIKPRANRFMYMAIPNISRPANSNRNLYIVIPDKLPAEGLSYKIDTKAYLIKDCSITTTYPVYDVSALTPETVRYKDMARHNQDASCAIAEQYSRKVTQFMNAAIPLLSMVSLRELKENTPVWDNDKSLTPEILDLTTEEATAYFIMSEVTDQAICYATNIDMYVHHFFTDPMGAYTRSTARKHIAQNLTMPSSVSKMTTFIELFDGVTSTQMTIKDYLNYLTETPINTY